ncbi:MAG TPA: zf-HC2 domain-containing protein [Candidatus Krumholzibacteria bacterium]|nr:zf-HC2 domain-containing protein [Candidatus Krumholzibacteria bacterium]
MNDVCTHIESLLPGYCEQQLDASDTARVRAHVETCESCRASLAAFAELEGMLVARRLDVPPVERFLPEFTPSHALAPHSSRLIRAFRATMSVPGIAIVLSVWAGLLALRFRDAIGSALSFSTPGLLTGFSERFANLMVFLTDGNVWVLIGVCSLVAFAIAGSMSAMSLRYLRH